MPHVVLEYTATLPSSVVASALSKAHELVGATPTIDPAAVKSRAYPATFFHVGTEHGHASYMHLQVALLAGRETELLAALADRLHAMLQDVAGVLTNTHCALTVEIREMNAATYRK
jgi:5-carboxymethyl-2-hydroxymuconate isomerase